MAIATSSLKVLRRPLEPKQDASITLVSGALTPDGNGIAIISSACTAVEVLGRGLALELAPRRVNTLSPGPVRPPLL